MATIQRLALDVVLCDADLQPRDTMSNQAITDYAELYADGHDLPPLVVFQDGIDYWLADGFHRVQAAREAGLTELPAEVHQGTKREALWYSCGANKHGKARTNADKRRQVLRLLNDAEWEGSNDYEIGRHCGVAHSFVSKLRKSLSILKEQIDVVQRQVTRNGTTYLMDTTNIGRIDRYEDHFPRKEDVPADDIPRAVIEANFSVPLRMVSSAPPVPKGQPRPTFNRTNEMVDWAKWTWNPVTGCLHNCEYCYAARIAERFYPEKFEPTFRPERLKAPHYTPVPPQAETEVGYRNVFVCSMADLFGKWVPEEWIEAVMTEVRAAPQWNFLFLTKFPQRLESITWPQNAWVGTTVDEQYRVSIAEKAFRNVDAPVKWLSCEPLRERLTFTSLDMFDWVVLGGQTAQTGDNPCPGFQPPWEWIEHLTCQAREANCLLYWKPNLLTRPQEYPGQKEVPTP